MNKTLKKIENYIKKSYEKIIIMLFLKSFWTEPH